MRKFIVAGNWKMNGSLAANDALIAGILAGMPDSENVDLLICPPMPYLATAADKIAGSRLKLGAQTVSEHESGAYTGETAPSMLRDVGCEFVLVGHSERRALYGESAQAVAAKYVAAQSAGLIPVLCLGESLEERESGKTEQVIDEQLNAVLDSAGVATLANAVIAYEPVWAIGTGKTASPEQAQDVHEHIRRVVGELDETMASAVQILYGGSVKGDNAAGLFGKPDIDGGLIGGASLKSEDFLAIANAAAALG